MSPNPSTFEQFPLPSQLPLSRTCPRVLGGANQESSEAIRENLIYNHENHHIFFNEEGFHNHSVHHVLAIWALGASAETIKQGYKANEDFLKDPVQSPGEVTRANWIQHLGKSDYYSAYVKFFKGLIAERGGLDGVIEEFITSPKANFQTNGESPDMLTRFLSGLVHPIIHACYGLEFGIPAIVAEGLAMTAVHKAGLTTLVKPLYEEPSTATGLASRFQSALGLGSGTTQQLATANVHAFTIFSKILSDDRFRYNTEAGVDSMLVGVIEKQGSALLDLAQQWTLNANDPKDVERKVEELQWLVTLMYAAPKQDLKTEPLADFVLMHLITSSLFLPVVVEHLSPESKNRMLRAFFHNALAVYIARGRPQLDIPGLYARDLPSPQMLEGEPRYSVSPGLKTDSTTWMSLIHTTILHHDQHLCKIQRALFHYSSLYGAKKGSTEFAETGLKDAEKLDGRLFLKAALITNTRMTRERGEDGKPPFWDFKGFFEE